MYFVQYQNGARLTFATCRDLTEKLRAQFYKSAGSKISQPNSDNIIPIISYIYFHTLISYIASELK
jgi:hypothetical protein